MQTTMFQMFDAHPGRPLKVLIGCEQSGVVRDAFNALGHDAWSCDLLAAETPSNRHIVGDVRDVMMWDDWDLLAVMHPQSVQPWHFGTDEAGPDNEKKRTCFWLRNLPKLRATGTLDGSTARDSVHKASPGKDRWKERSRFFPGIAEAMADQWGGAAQLAARAA